MILLIIHPKVMMSVPKCSFINFDLSIINNTNKLVKISNIIIKLYF